MTMMRRRMGGFVMASAAAGLLAATVGSAACDGCPFQITDKINFQGTLEAGAFATHDVNVPAEDDLQIDLASTATAGSGRADAWITQTDCARLFDTAPSEGAALPTARCTVIVGPVTAGTVSSRQKISAGRFRVFVQSYASNAAPAAYQLELGTWGRTCRGVNP